jgi:KTSC domain
VANEVVYGGRGSMAIKNYPVQSSAVVRIDYDEDSQTVFFTFKDGRNYSIENFPEIEVERWANAESVGRYWNFNLRGKY